MTYPFVQVVQNLDFDNSLAMETLLVPDNLDGNILPSLVVVALGDLAERTLAEHVQNLVTVHQMVMVHNQIVSPLIIIAYTL
jgi:hypothetical protein